MNHEINTKEILELYKKYSADLERVRQEQIEFYGERGYLPEKKAPWNKKIKAFAKKAKTLLQGAKLLKPQLDDIEAELTYLLLREQKPETVVEISPCGGWSSTWILKALRDNKKGHLYSFDLIDDSVKNIPKELAKGRRTFIQGPVQENLDKLPKQIDYLFMDSDHSAKFAEWYIENLFTRLKPGTPVSVHDVFHTDDPSGFDSEGGVVIGWLNQKKVKFFTASPAKNRESYQALSELKNDLGLTQTVHRSQDNSMIFFRAPQVPPKS
jgi:predicted O-methyltransferase YrrM